MSRYLPPGNPEFSRLFDTFAHTAYRLETLQRYREPTETAALTAYLGGREPEVYPGKRQWIALVQAARAAGKVMQRVHVVSEPLSDYLLYEVGWSYQLNVNAGEDVRILPASGAPAGLPADYWLFDSSTLARMDYLEDGRMAGIELVTHAPAIVDACYWRDAALHAAVPYRDYVARVPLQHAS